MKVADMLLTMKPAVWAWAIWTTLCSVCYQKWVAIFQTTFVKVVSVPAHVGKANKMKMKCPKDPNHKKFKTTAHVIQLWEVDETGDFLREINSAEDITHWPSTDNTWTCSVCGAEAQKVVA